MQDGTPLHTAVPEKRLLRSTFGKDRIICRYFKHAWPPRSLLKSPYDFWLWGFLKSKVYRDQPASLEAW
ncbi:uncharacterized protein TNCV_3807191 [Trichonephila clavipes]|nr:uncharacterized protein TNCV_3807191 [Trichonephila clavipes]